MFELSQAACLCHQAAAGSFIVSVVGANGICHHIDMGALVFICIRWPFRNAALRRRGVVLPRTVSSAIGCVRYSHIYKREIGRASCL